MTPAPPPPEFFARLEAGDDAAIKEFVDRYAKVANTLLRGRFTQITLAEREDLVQEILIEVLEKLGAYDRSRPFNPWFITIVRRRALDFLRKNAGEWIEGEFGRLPTFVSLDYATGRDAPDSLKKQVVTAVAGQPAPDAGLEDDSDASHDESVTDGARPTPGASPPTRLGELLAEVVAWASSRDPKEQALLSHYMYGASWEEVATKLTGLGDSVSPNTAKVRGHRLLQKAVKELGREERER